MQCLKHHIVHDSDVTALLANVIIFSATIDSTTYNKIKLQDDPDSDIVIPELIEGKVHLVINNSVPRYKQPS